MDIVFVFIKFACHYMLHISNSITKMKYRLSSETGKKKRKKKKINTEVLETYATSFINKELVK